ncbi:ATP-dependent DNA ligase [archaeon SCG-AAA382B04]|nr:ATP-dependent DNA ligase [archaeon SCG-AAA382B04]
MLFSEVAEHFEKLEKTQSRLEMIDILEELFNDTPPNSIDKLCYLLLGEIDADFKHIKLGLGEKLVQKGVAKAFSLSNEEVEKLFRETGDLGEAAEVASEKGSKGLKAFTKGERKGLSLKEVHSSFLKIANAEGSGSQDKKLNILAGLLSNSTNKGCRYITRIALSKLRLGVGDMTILDALAETYTGSKDNRPQIEHIYNISSDVGLVAKKVAEDGVSGLDDVGVEIGRPIRMMLAQRLKKLSEIKEKMGGDEFAAEEKYDGERMQIHKDGENVRVFSRRLEEITKQYPDVVEYIKDNVDIDEAIMEGEAVAVQDGELQSFQKLMRRKRKYDIEEFVDKIPVKLFLFDLLYVEGESYLKKSYPKRREKLEQIVDETDNLKFSRRIVTDNLDKIDEFFEESINRGNEGILAKSCDEDSVYRAGAREWLWIKWKKDYTSKLSDTLDLTVVGALAGKGRRSGTYGALLCAAYNHEKDVFETLCKVGTGFTDEDLELLPKKLEEFEIDHKPARVVSEIEPTQWFQPNLVVEVEGAELTKSPVHTAGLDRIEEDKGLAIRFPRYLNLREDKSPDESTTVSELMEMYENQEKI